MNKIYFFSYLVSPGGPLRRTHGYQIFRAVRLHHRADKFIIIGLGHLASQLSSHLYQSTYKIWKQSNMDFLSYRENDEVSADAA